MEIEAKFALPDAETLQRLATADDLAGFALSRSEIRKMRDTYLDTTGRLIRTAGYACRRRESDGAILITLKRLDNANSAVHRREEHEITLASDLPPADWPANSARDRVLEIINDAGLVPLFDLEQTRTVRAIHRGDDTIAELSLDNVRVDAGGQTLSFLELEVELMPSATEDDLAAIVKSLQEEWNLQPEPRSKFERALEFVDAMAGTESLLTPAERAVCAHIATLENACSRRAQALLALDGGASPAEAGTRAGLSPRRVKYWRAAFQKKRLDVFPERLRIVEATKEPRDTLQPSLHPGLNIEDSMSEAARKTLLFHFQRMLEHEAGTRAGQNMDELHDMRVATRRMRAALQVFDRYLSADAIKPFAKVLRRTSWALGAVRDLDVFDEKTRRYLDALPVERKNELDLLLNAWRVELDARRAELLAHLDSENYLRFKEQFGEFLNTPGAGATSIVSRHDEPRPYRVRHTLPVCLYENYSRVRAYDEWVIGADVPLSRFHQLRIASKGLRYALEFFQEVLDPGAETLIEKMKNLQDHLGNLQDAVVSCNVLRNLLLWGTWQSRERKGPPQREVIVAPGVATYLAARQEEIQGLVNAFPSVWSEVSSQEFSRQLAALAAAL